MYFLLKVYYTKAVRIGDILTVSHKDIITLIYLNTSSSTVRKISKFINFDTNCVIYHTRFL